jgi:hypothetical protein
MQPKAGVAQLGLDDSGLAGHLGLASERPSWRRISP